MLTSEVNSNKKAVLDGTACIFPLRDGYAASPLAARARFNISIDIIMESASIASAREETSAITGHPAWLDFGAIRQCNRRSNRSWTAVGARSLRLPPSISFTESLYWA